LVQSAGSRLLQPVGIKLRVEADHKRIPRSIGRGTQVAAGADRLFQNLILFAGDALEPLKFLPLGDGDAAGLFEQIPGSAIIEALGARIDNLYRFNLRDPKKLLGIFT